MMFSAIELVTCEARTHARISEVLENAALPQSGLLKHILGTEGLLLETMTDQNSPT